MHSFGTYLEENNLEALTVSVAAKVRYLTVYNATKGNPINVQDAERIRIAAFRLCGVVYKGVFAVHVDDEPTRPMSRISMRHSRSTP